MSPLARAPDTIGAQIASLAGQRFGVILADPPWHHRTFSKKGEGRAAVRHYPTMSLKDICALDVASLAAKDCHLMLWTTTPHLQQCFEVAQAWGFKYSSSFKVWIKLNPREAGALMVLPKSSFHVGLGHTTRKNAELCLLFRKGAPKRLSKSVRELLISPRREHSRKPDEFIEDIEKYAAGPFLELFGRQQRPGWTVIGNEVDKFG